MAQGSEGAQAESRYTSRLKESYRSEFVPQMMERYSYKNRMAVPRLHKIVR